MPFTTSHPAIVLPLKKLYPSVFSLSGLIAGAMSPDLLYFFEMTTINRGISHSWGGLFTVCLPLGILFTLFFHHFIKYELIRNLPKRLENHFSGLAVSEFGPTSFIGWVKLILSILIGALSHFFWDSFTHLHGESVTLFPVLADNIIIFGRTIPLYHFLQHLSTVVGGIAIVMFFSFKSNLPPRVTLKKIRPRINKILFWAVSTSLAVLFAFSVLELYLNFFPDRVPGKVVVLGLASWAGFFYLTAFYGLIKRIRLSMNNSIVSEYN